MRIDIMTLFPDTVNAVLHESIIGRAAKKGIVEINCVQIRDFTENKQNQVDDYPYGGGFGCVMMAQPLKSCLDHIMSTAGERRSRVIYMSAGIMRAWMSALSSSAWTRRYRWAISC